MSAISTILKMLTLGTAKSEISSPIEELTGFFYEETQGLA